jgi:hypothetical protein
VGRSEIMSCAKHSVARIQPRRRFWWLVVWGIGISFRVEGMCRLLCDREIDNMLSISMLSIVRAFPLA